MLELCESSWCHFEVTALMSFISCQSSCIDTDNMEDMSSCLEAITRTTSQQHRTFLFSSCINSDNKLLPYINKIPFFKNIGISIN